MKLKTKKKKKKKKIIFTLKAPIATAAEDIYKFINTFCLMFVSEN